MRIPSRCLLHWMLVCHTALEAQARALPMDALTGITIASRVSPAELRQRDLSKRTIVHGLPSGWHGVYKSVKCIQPPLPTPVFANFFLHVAEAARKDPVWGRSYRKFTYGALVLEFASATPDDMSKVVTKEFAEAAALWLFQAAQRGWSNFFEAWILDAGNKELIYVHVANIWDALTASR